MASMDWFRWHHGSVTDPKFQLIARKSGCSVAEVIGFWAMLLESASMNEVRGCTGYLDFEAIDCALGLQDGKAQELHSLMVARGLVDEVTQSIHSWAKRQPAREREDDKSSERVKAFRDRQRNETPCNATKRLEEIRGDKKNTPLPPEGAGEGSQPPGQPDSQPRTANAPTAEFPPGFAEFWKTWPTNDRKQARGKCFDAWKKANAERDAALVLAHVAQLKTCEMWTKEAGRFVPAPLVYLGQRRWDGAKESSPNTGGILRGAI